MALPIACCGEKNSRQILHSTHKRLRSKTTGQVLPICEEISLTMVPGFIDRYPKINAPKESACLHHFFAALKLLS